MLGFAWDCEWETALDLQSDFEWDRRWVTASGDWLAMRWECV